MEVVFASLILHTNKVHSFVSAVKRLNQTFYFNAKKKVRIEAVVYLGPKLYAENNVGAALCIFGDI
jgi:hypothetical protein